MKLKYHEILNPYNPWLVKNAVEFLNEYLKPNDKILEFGAGRSTSWFLKKGCLVTSVETSKEWFGVVKRRNKHFISQGLLNLTTTFPEKDNSNQYDCILIDGGDRELAARIALSVIKPGGIIVFDNVERYMPTGVTNTPSHVLLKRETPAFQDLYNRYKKFRSIIYSNGVTQTAVFFNNA